MKPTTTVLISSIYYLNVLYTVQNSILPTIQRYKFTLYMYKTNFQNICVCTAFLNTGMLDSGIEYFWSTWFFYRARPSSTNFEHEKCHISAVVSNSNWYQFCPFKPENSLKEKSSHT